VLPAVPWPDDRWGRRTIRSSPGAGRQQAVPVPRPGQTRSGRRDAVFAASPNYGGSTRADGRPSIREIAPPVSDSLWEKGLKDGVVDILTDVPAAAVEELQDKVPNITVFTQRTRQSTSWRSTTVGPPSRDRPAGPAACIAHKIDRKKILDDFFRRLPNAHRELTALPGRLVGVRPGHAYNPILARTRLHRVQPQGHQTGAEISVRRSSLASGDGVPARDSVKTALEGKVEIELKAMTPRAS
jgi:hypothetical protein